MKFHYFLLSLIFASCTTSKTIVRETEVAKPQPIQINYLVNQTQVSDFLKTLSSDEMQGRGTAEPGIEKAAAFLEDYLSKNQIKPYFKTYRDTLTNYSSPAFNIVGYIEGNDPELKNQFIMLSAHYDHIGTEGNSTNEDKINNGANDDASGVTAVAEIAKYFSESKTNKRSILVVFFTAEEKGLLGSKHLANKLKQQDFNLYTQLNFEMIGVPMKRDYLAYITGFELSNMATKINLYSGKKTVGFLPKAGEYQLFKRSDNYPFYEDFKAPCQSFSTFDFENFKFYHHVDDEFETIDTEHLTHFIQEMLPVVSQITTTKEKEIKLN